jgi:hypothetical protein
MRDSRLFHSTSIHFPCLPRKKYEGISSLGMVSGPKTDSSDPNYVLHWQRIRGESCLPVPPALESWTQQVWEDSNITHLIYGKTCVHHGALLSEKLKDTISRYLKCMINIDQWESPQGISQNQCPSCPRRKKKRSSPRGMMACAPAWRTQASKGCK